MAFGKSCWIIAEEILSRSQVGIPEGDLLIKAAAKSLYLYEGPHLRLHISSFLYPYTSGHSSLSHSSTHTVHHFILPLSAHKALFLTADYFVVIYLLL